MATSPKNPKSATFKTFMQSTKYIIRKDENLMNNKVYIAMHHKMGAIEPQNGGIMLTKKQITILEPFLVNVFAEHGQRELGRLAKKRSNNSIQRALTEFEKENIVTFNKVGTSKRYKINLDNEKSYDYLTLLQNEKLTKVVRQSIEILKKEIEKHTLFYSLVIFGSYVVGKQNKDSDLDIAIFIPDKNQENNIKIAGNMVKNKSLLNLDIQIITFDEMVEMLVNKHPNLGKEIARKHMAIHNVNIFYKIVRRAIENGFTY